MKKYQIIYNWGGSSRSFKYFEANGNVKEMAEKTANEDLKKQSESRGIMRAPYKPPKTLSIVEYDNVKKCTVRGGEKYKLRLMYFEAKTNLRTIKEALYVINKEQFDKLK